MLSLTIASCIEAPRMRACRVIHTAAWVDTRGMLGVPWMQTMREHQVGQRRRPPRKVVWSKSHLTRRKKVACRGEFLSYRYGTYTWSIACFVYLGTPRMLSWCPRMHLVITWRTMATCDTLSMLGSGSILTPIPIIVVSFKKSSFFKYLSC